MTSPDAPRIRPTWVAFGWFIAASVTSLALFALWSLGLPEASETGDLPWVAASIALGFGVGGLFAGWRSGSAPVLHGVGIGLFSLVVWMLANLLSRLVFREAGWETLPFTTGLFLIVLQILSAAVGAWIGIRWTHTAPRA